MKQEAGPVHKVVVEREDIVYRLVMHRMLVQDRQKMGNKEHFLPELFRVRRAGAPQERSPDKKVVGLREGRRDRMARSLEKRVEEGEVV